MSDTPASWQPDPTGRHDHRYWDGTQWTEHVADAGVAATDPYDGGTAEGATTADDAGATPDAEAAAATTSAWGAGAETTATTEPATQDQPAAGGAGEPSAGDPEPAAGTAASASASGWALPEETTSAVSGWGDAGAPSATTPDVGQAAPPASWGAPSEGTAPATEDDTAAIPVATGSSWEQSTSVLGPPTETTSTWTGVSSETPGEGVPPLEPGGPSGKGRSGKVLLLVLALLVIVGVLVALVALSGDDDGDSGEVADRISAALQDDLDMSEDDADCIGDHITDEIGADRLEGVDFSQPEAPPALEDDFNEAFAAAIAECDVDSSDLTGASAESDGDGEGDGEDEPLDVELGEPEEFAALLTESYEETLGIGPEKSRCLADRMVEAVQSGEVSEEDAFGEFFDFLEDCEISLEELRPPTG